MSWIERAKVGDKIVCIDTDWRDIHGNLIADDLHDPSINEIVTIHAIVPIDDCVMLGLVEYPGVKYEHAAFKPIKNTDAEVQALKRLCLNTPEAVS